MMGNNEKPIADYVMAEPNSGCHLWVGALNPGGYGKKVHLGKLHLAHRIVYEIENGKIQNGMTLDHLCRVRSCVNPKHMEVVELKENILRGFSPSALHARKKFCPKCFGPYTKYNRQRVCVNCRRIYERKRYAINNCDGRK